MKKVCFIAGKANKTPTGKKRKSVISVEASVHVSSYDEEQ